MDSQDQQLMDQYDAAREQFYRDLYASQTPLIPALERVLYDNLWELCEQ